MPARPDFEPILPKGPITHTNIARVHAALRDFAAKSHARLAAYPPQTPSAAASYRRTGRLGQGWTTRGPQMSGTSLEIVVGNAIEYAPLVQGFKTHSPLQVRWASPYGWVSVEDITRQEWAIARPRIEAALEGK